MKNNNISSLPEHSRHKPFLTIGIASYNYASYLPYAFQQIRKQKFSDFEILYCDDGSKDSSTDVICNFIDSHPELCIRLIKEKMKDSSLIGPYIGSCQGKVPDDL